MYSRGNPGEEYEALKELAAPLAAWLAESYASEPNPDQGDQRQHEGVNPVDPLLYNPSRAQPEPECVNSVDTLYNPPTSQPDPVQGDERLYECKNPVDTLLYNSST